MARAPLRHCPSCRRLIRGTCESCRTAARRETYRRRKSDSFYASAPWRKLRARKLRIDPLCADCEAKGQIEPAVAVDHVLDRRDRPDLELDIDNLRSLCVPCHNRKTALTRRRGGGGLAPLEASGL